MSDDRQLFDDDADSGNRAGQPALSYRAGTHATFLARMLAQLPAQGAPPEAPGESRPLAALTTRSPDDITIALLDAWAMVGDVLTFYQERIANEGYLRTATERRSVLELARAVGYELNPGAAASTDLAFTAEDAPGSPAVVMIPRGTRVQSLPGQDELPQTFETGAPIEARAAYNRLLPRRSTPARVLVDGGGVRLETAAGDEIAANVLYLAGTNTNLAPYDLVLVSSAEPSAITLLSVAKVELDLAAARTKVTFVGATEATGALQIEPQGLDPGAPTEGPVAFTRTEIESRVLERRWTEHDLATFVASKGWDPAELERLVAALVPVSVSPVTVYAFRQKVPFFGQSALDASTLGLPKAEWETNTSIFTNSKNRDYRSTHGVDAFLDRVVPGLAPQSFAVVVDEGDASPLGAMCRVAEVKEASLADFGTSARVTGVRFDPDVVAALGAIKRRTAVAYLQAVELPLAPVPLDHPVAGTSGGASRLALDRLVLGLRAGQPVVVTGEPTDAPGLTRSEVAEIESVEHVAGFTAIALRSPLRSRYVRRTFALNANVVAATHGETTRSEVLGSGDGKQRGQAFSLRKRDLTYVSAPVARGAKSTVEVRVDGVLWDEAPSLHGLDGSSRSYTLRTGDDGTTTVSFGDGRSGARLPSGQDNVVASYRTGIGLAGNVPAGRLILPLDRPLGIRGVTNPLAASGAAAPESLELARGNAPLAALTLERVVSLRDYEDFTNAFAGIGKARASLLRSRGEEVVHVTVAGDRGALVPESSALLVNLVKAVDAARAPGPRVEIVSYEPIYFDVKARLVIDPRLRAAEVLEHASDALRRAFSFDRREFGQSLHKAEVVRVLQDVAGVVAVFVDALHLFMQTKSIQEVLSAALARWNAAASRIAPAEMLLPHPAGIDLTEVSA